MNINERNAADHVLLEIANEGYDAYIVGGFVRDHLLNVESDDIDIVTDCPMDILDNIFHCIDIGKSKDFGIVTVCVNDYNFEVANYRADVYENDNGKGADKTKIVNTLKEDVSRRDFTINAMAMDFEGKIIDYYDGVQDLANGVIRAVGNPEDRIKEDAVRMLRAIRFAARLDFKIDYKLMMAIMKNAEDITKVAPERIHKELMKMMAQPGPKVAIAVEHLIESGLMEFILPEVVEMKKFKHNHIHHPEGATVEAIDAYSNSTRT
jgi:tRNA nucleotidyltransferase (CCA-adding enzyme)